MVEVRQKDLFIESDNTKTVLWGAKVKDYALAKNKIKLLVLCKDLF